jgi:hypothetical protein
MLKGLTPARGTLREMPEPMILRDMVRGSGMENLRKCASCHHIVDKAMVVCPFCSGNTKE